MSWVVQASGDAHTLSSAGVGHHPRHTDNLWAFLKMHKVKVKVCPWQRRPEGEIYGIQKEIQSSWGNRKVRPKHWPKAMKWGRGRVEVSPELWSARLWWDFQAGLLSLGAALSRVSPLYTVAFPWLFPPMGTSFPSLSAPSPLFWLKCHFPDWPD